MPLHAPRPGDFSWHELSTSDPAAAFDFYSQLFGWTKAGETDMGRSACTRCTASVRSRSAFALHAPAVPAG